MDHQVHEGTWWIFLSRGENTQSQKHALNTHKCATAQKHGSVIWHNLLYGHNCDTACANAIAKNDCLDWTQAIAIKPMKQIRNLGVYLHERA